MKILVGLIELHKEVFLTCDIFFVNKFPLLLTLSLKIYFMAVNHLENCTVTEIFKAFKEVYQYDPNIYVCLNSARCKGVLI